MELPQGLEALVNPLIEVRRGDWDVDPEGAPDKPNRCKKTCHLLLVGAIPRRSKELW